MVENVVVAVGISFLSYSVTEIESTSGVLTAILISASHMMAAKMENNSKLLWPVLFYKFSAKPSTIDKNYTRLTDIPLLDVPFTFTFLADFQPPSCFISG